MAKAKVNTGVKAQPAQKGLVIEVSRIHILKDPKGATKAFADIIVEKVLVVKSLRVVEGNNGMFVSMPQDKAENGKWYSTVFPVTRSLRDTIEEIVLKSYEEALQPVA